MPWISLGVVTIPAPGNNVQATNARDSAQLNTAYYQCMAILFQADPFNVGRTYIGTVGFSKTTGVGRLAVLAIPTANTIPSAGATNPIPGRLLAATDFWLDADVMNDKVTVSILIA